MSAKATTVIFDMDGVLTRHDTMSFLVRERIVRNPLRLLLALPLVLAMTVLANHPRPHGIVLRALVMVGLAGMPHAEYADLARDTARKLAQGADWAIPQGIAAIRAHIAAGDDVTVTTGCEVVLAEAFLQQFGLGGVRLSGSVYAPGQRYFHNFEANKLGTLGTLEIELSNALFYTDSTADLPLARSVRLTRLVNPNEHTRRRFMSEVPALEIVVWP